MRLVAGIAQHAAGMLGRDHLREALGLGRVLFMAAPAEVGYIGEDRLVGGRVVGMLRQRPVTGFAGHVGVLSGGARLALVVMTHQTHILAGESDGFRPDQRQRLGAVMAVLAESFRHHGGADGQKEAEAENKNYCRTYEMARVPKNFSMSVWVKHGEDQMVFCAEIGPFYRNIQQFVLWDAAKAG